MTAFDRSNESAAEVYNFNNSTYGGTVVAAESNTSILFFVETSGGPAMFVVHDAPNDSGGGTVEMVLDERRALTAANLLVRDDPLPDPADTWADYRFEWAYAAIRQSIAAIVVAFPLFLVVWRMLLKEINAHPEKAHSRVRLALIYLSLLVGAITLVSDVIALIYQLLEGELSARFLLKVATLFVITAAAFTYFALNLRETEEAP